MAAPTSEGKPLNPSNLYRNFDTVVAAVGVKRIPFHGMSHSHATLLLAAGMPIKAVSEHLGHGKTSDSLDTFAHVLPAMEDRVIDAIDGAFIRATV